MSTTLMARNTRSRGPPLRSIRASAASPTVVKNISSRVSFSARLKPSFTCSRPSTSARTIATRPPPTTGAGMLSRLSAGTWATSRRPRKNTSIATSSVETRSNPTVRTVVSRPGQGALCPGVRGQRIGLQQLQALAGVVPVDLLHVELPHERDDLRRDDLAGHHDREARRVGDHELRGHQLRALGEPLVDLPALELDVLA